MNGLQMIRNDTNGGNKMKVIVCLDDADGMLFNKRRQSKDKVLREYLLETIENQNLWMNEYSKKQFEEDDTRIIVAEDYLDQAGENDFCFVETEELFPYEEKIHSIFVVHWNRKYPSDVFFDLDYHNEEKWKLARSKEIIGNSHPVILIEEYVKA